MKGTAPPGARNEREAAAWVRGMFARVARRYDVANHLLSFNIDRLWRARTVRRVRPMLVAARRKGAAGLFEADALRLPLRDASLDLVTVAFGFRNLANYRVGLAEMRRVLRPAGMAAILEFSEPPNAGFAALYHFYSRRILPLIGGALSGSREAYTYLPESVRKFPSAEELAKEMRRAGFREVRYERFSGGIVALHLGVTPPRRPPA